MARYEDYVNKTDDLQDEIDHAAVEAENRAKEDDLPERFKGKSAAEIAKSYEELEKLQSRQAQSLGEMRQQVDELVRQSESRDLEDDNSAEPVTVDDLYDDPEATIGKIVERTMQKQAPKEDTPYTETTEFQERVKDMDEKFDGWRDVTATPEFQNWLVETPYRARIAQAANNFDMDAASDLLDEYYTLQGIGKESPEEEAQRRQALADGTLESGGAEYEEPPQTFSRREIMDRRILAKSGNREADYWLRDNADAISRAYAGRVVD